MLPRDAGNWNDTAGTAFASRIRHTSASICGRVLFAAVPYFTSASSTRSSGIAATLSTSAAYASSLCPAAAAAPAFKSVHVAPCAPDGRSVFSNSSSASAKFRSATSACARAIASCRATRRAHVLLDGNTFAMSRETDNASDGIVSSS